MTIINYLAAPGRLYMGFLESELRARGIMPGGPVADGQSVNTVQQTTPLSNSINDSVDLSPEAKAILEAQQNGGIQQPDGVFDIQANLNVETARPNSIGTFGDPLDVMLDKDYERIQAQLRVVQASQNNLEVLDAATTKMQKILEDAYTRYDEYGLHSYAQDVFNKRHLLEEGRNFSLAPLFADYLETVPEELSRYATVRKEEPVFDIQANLNIQTLRPDITDKMTFSPTVRIVKDEARGGMMRGEVVQSAEVKEALFRREYGDGLDYVLDNHYRSLKPHIQRLANNKLTSDERDIFLMELEITYRDQEKYDIHTYGQEVFAKRGKLEGITIDLPRLYRDYLGIPLERWDTPVA
ncbi:MAG: hypothetical protein KDD76_05375 [Rickettsiales bacterium]|nr:hypothetical protein [Rickettsiales bacterium]